jgi:hypothetical protein
MFLNACPGNESNDVRRWFGTLLSLESVTASGTRPSTKVTKLYFTNIAEV